MNRELQARYAHITKHIATNKYGRAYQAYLDRFNADPNDPSRPAPVEYKEFVARYRMHLITVDASHLSALPPYDLRPDYTWLNGQPVPRHHS